MSLTALTLYILKKSEYELEDIKEGWIDIQRERADRDFKKAIESESPTSLNYLEEEISKYHGSNISKILEPGYQQRMKELIEENERESV